MYGTSEPKTVKVDDVEEVSRGDERDNSSMQRRYLCFVQRIADECFNCLSHGVPPYPVYNLCLSGTPGRMIHKRIVA